ncbi:hypothetical protein RTCIAT899_PA00730 (plasmid) [Rhizobium tropici CIAT 899]|nr:hypothetical protein RTCIAT899_PA00730 [Rhizobium tropici CIAT 899]
MAHISIKTKMLLLVVPICVIGIAGLTFDSLKHRGASQSYVNFIAEDGADAIHIARANQHFTAVSYNAYQTCPTTSKTSTSKNLHSTTKTTRPSCSWNYVWSSDCCRSTRLRWRASLRLQTIFFSLEPGLYSRRSKATAAHHYRPEAQPRADRPVVS